MEHMPTLGEQNGETLLAFTGICMYIFPTWSGLAWIQISEFKGIQLLRSFRKIIQDQHVYFQMGGLTINYSNPIILPTFF